MNEISFVLPLLKHLLGHAAKDAVGKRMTAGLTAIEVGMHQKGMEPPGVTPAVCSRDAMFRLFKAAVHSGDIADLIRDHLSPTVVPAVVASLSATPTVHEIVIATRDEALSAIFG